MEKVIKNNLAHDPSISVLTKALESAGIDFIANYTFNISKTRRFDVSFIINGNIVVNIESFRNGTTDWYNEMLMNNELQLMGYKVLRYSSRNVIKNVRPIIKDIKSLIESIESDDLNFFSLDK